ncbi:hypothetical protein NFJ02_33g84270 [Pycnococcus provasolii]
MYGGMGGGLHAALYAGLHVRKYVHIDKDEAAQKFIDADTRELQWKWVQQLGAAAFYDIFSAGHEVEAVARGELGWLDRALGGVRPLVFGLFGETNSATRDLIKCMGHAQHACICSPHGTYAFSPSRQRICLLP